MKMTNEDLLKLKGYLAKVSTSTNVECSNMVNNWNRLWAANIPFEFFNHLYTYLNDDHINTALASIFGNDGKNSKGRTR